MELPLQLREREIRAERTITGEALNLGMKWHQEEIKLELRMELESEGEETSAISNSMLNPNLKCNNSSQEGAIKCVKSFQPPLLWTFLHLDLAAPALTGKNLAFPAKREE